MKMIAFRILGAMALTAGLSAANIAHAQSFAGARQFAAAGPVADNPGGWDDESFKRQGLREEMEQLRKEHEDLEAEHEQLQARCHDAKAALAEQCEQDRQALHARRDALHERLHALHEKIRADRAAHPEQGMMQQAAPHQ